MNHDKFAPQPVRYVTKSLHLECWVKERTASSVTYFFGNDPDATYTKSVADFDATYVLPGKR